MLRLDTGALEALMAASPTAFEAAMAEHFPSVDEDPELKDLEITAPSGGILREAAATAVAAQRLHRKSAEAAAKAEWARHNAVLKVARLQCGQPRRDHGPQLVRGCEAPARPPPTAIAGG